MKDIILIDDNSKGQRESYGASYVDEETFSGILIHIEHLNKDTDLSFLNGAKCVLIHDSLEDWIDGNFDQYSHIAKDVILETLDMKNIPYVCFSDGHQSIGSYDHSKKNIVALKKSDFYSRLYYFLEHYISEGEIQFHILAYGINYLKELLLMNAKGLVKKLQTMRPSKILSSSDVMPEDKEEPHYLEELVALAQPAIGINYDGLLNMLDDEAITVKDFQRQLNNIIISVSRNGKNTYTWK